MVKSSIAGLRIPSVRKELAAAAAGSPSPSIETEENRRLTLLYPISKATLQVSGVHLRLAPLLKKEVAVTAASIIPLAVTVVIRAHVRGELSHAPQSFVAGVAAMQYGEQEQQVEPLPTLGQVTHVKSSNKGHSSFDKRQQQQRTPLAKAPALASVFIPLDMRLQMERVTFTVEVLPSATRFRGEGAVKRDRQDGKVDSAGPVLLDCALDVTVMGAISSLV